MAQEFLVLRCFTCQSFQVQQVKKVTKWTCTLCGEKQSLLKEFGRGSGADCRRHVQKLNAMRGAKMEDQEQHTLSLWKQEGEEEPEEQVSSWSKYLDTPEEAGPKEEDVLMDSQQLHDNGMIDRKRERGRQEEGTPGQSGFRSSRSDPLAGEESPDPAGSLSADGQVGGASSMISENRPRPLRPVSSMFDSGEDFSLDL
ncbi:hypothetical protein CesoFtcFv8_009605 [Champsocephalus esox]|uniref:MRN complex-interacting protein N-terminal domain-containing protein n=1 Tax=Champsocephalus esox TaxID=159716 RepID=A0AAN8C7A2_9TELE|nr:hypothetical protein CesoFtcFv8_009605 [Champsocephalus esox]